MKLKIGIIGCGTHAQHHADYYGANFVTHGVWDPNPEAMKQIEGRQYATLEDLLADPAIDAVIICSPDKFHLAQIEMALMAGKHVFCEKPLLIPGENIQQLQVAFALARAQGLVLTSCHPRRFDRPILWLQDQMRPSNGGASLTERFGKVVSFDFDFSYHAPSTDWKNGRSLLLDHVNHEVDLMNYLFEIQGFVAWQLNDGFDLYDVVGRRDDGITFHLHGTRRLTESVYPEWCRVRLERGEVALDMMMGQAHISDHDNKRVNTVSGLTIDYAGRLEKVMADFHGEIHGNPGYLREDEMIMNTQAGIILQNPGIQRVDVRS